MKAEFSPSSLHPWLESLAGQSESQIALSCAGGEAISFAALVRRIMAFAGGLESLGLRPGDRVAIWLPNSRDWLVAHLAAARLGLTTIPINTWSRTSELAHLLSLSECRAIILDSTFRKIDFNGILAGAVAVMGGPISAPLRWVIDAGWVEASHSDSDEIQRRSFSALCAVGSATAEPSVENMAMIAFSTSGTTALPKLAVHREHSILSHARAVCDSAQMTSDDVVLCALPPCGAYGYGLIFASLSAGARAVLCEDFDLDEIICLIARERVTMLALTEPIIRQLLSHPQAGRDNFRSLRIVFSAGATLEPLVRQAQDEFGFRISNVYGSSELLALAAFWGFGANVEERSAAGGRLISDNMRVRAVDSAGLPLPVGTLGELQFTGPVMLTNYLATSPDIHLARTSDGWFSSNDFGIVLDQAGRSFHYVSRRDDVLRLKGFLVNPGEIEAMLQSHPAVGATQVVGVGGADGEDVAAAFVIAAGDAEVTEDGLREFCRSRMASYKIPSLIRIVEEFPTTRSANGDKVVKERLREITRQLLTHD